MSYPCGIQSALAAFLLFDQTFGLATCLDGLPPEDEECLCSLRQETSKLVDQDVLNLVCLLDLDAYPHAVDAGLNEHSLVLVSRNDQGVHEDFGGGLGLDLGHIVTFRRLRCEVGQGESSRETAPHALQVGAEGLRLDARVSIVQVPACAAQSPLNRLPLFRVDVLVKATRIGGFSPIVYPRCLECR
jgi:hypothetical protein